MYYYVCTFLKCGLTVVATWIMLLINYFQISGLYSNVSGRADTNSGIETCSTQELGIKFAQGNNCGFLINLNLGK